jgi:hypothetical protein
MKYTLLLLATALAPQCGCAELKHYTAEPTPQAPTFDAQPVTPGQLDGVWRSTDGELMTLKTVGDEVFGVATEHNSVRRLSGRVQADDVLRGWWTIGEGCEVPPDKRGEFEVRLSRDAMGQLLDGRYNLDGKDAWVERWDFHMSTTNMPPEVSSVLSRHEAFCRHP